MRMSFGVLTVSLWLATALVLCAACGGSPTAPAPTPVATLTTIQDKLILPDWPCENDGGCQYQFRFRNDGPNCATGVKGTLRFGRNGTMLASDDWALAPERIVRVNELVEVTDRGLPMPVLIDGGTWDVIYQWRAIICP